MRDPYATLGVSKSSSEREIKSAFRKLAKQYHPDQNADNPKAQEKFAEVNTAYEILGDKEKRNQFDRGEIDAEGKPTGFGAGGPFSGHPFGGGGPFQSQQRGRQQRGGGGFSAEDILSEIFGSSRSGGAAPGADPFTREFNTHRAAPQKASEDIHVTLAVTLEELASSDKIRAEMPNGKTMSIQLPPGVEEGQVIRLRGQGASGIGRKNGDALITITIKNHPIFKRDGEILRVDIPLTLYEAVLGAKVKVPTLTGQVALTIPKKANGGQTLRIKQRGILKKDGSKGDILATLRVILPEGGSTDLETMMEVWRDQRPYKVRGQGFD